MIRDSQLQKALEELQQGKFIIITDAQDRENEADLVFAAQFVSEEKIAFMLQHTSGIICVGMEEKRLQELGLGPMVEQNTSKHSTPFTIPVDAKLIQDGGVSAHDRTLTIKALVEGVATDLVRPGHVFPLQARKQGVLERAGHTEASVDICKIASLYPAGVLCELMNPDGTMMRGTQLLAFAKHFKIAIITIEQIRDYLTHEKH
ncbi:3,4-dihydroxy-2-butanone-4-phosphate synthase [Candidatus Woesearchaeota archaeon]|nr:3,4-dihydroxy-2-butanone-4-phosphate synthase [Candidatus Woesearchaeota archaeon]